MFFVIHVAQGLCQVWAQAQPRRPGHLGDHGGGLPQRLTPAPQRATAWGL
jgi:hypothetical protein